MKLGKPSFKCKPILTAILSSEPSRQLMITPKNELTLGELRHGRRNDRDCIKMLFTLTYKKWRALKAHLCSFTTSPTFSLSKLSSFSLEYCNCSCSKSIHRCYSYLLDLYISINDVLLVFSA